MKDIDFQGIVESIVLPLAVAVTLIMIFGHFSSCSQNSQNEDTKQIKAYIDAGCEKVTVSGSTGTHWVCDDHSKQ